MKKPNDFQNSDDPRPPADALEKHVTGEGIGLGGGAIAGAAMGSSLGPLGAVTGAVLGGAFGAIAGRAIAQGIEPEASDTYQRRSKPDDSSLRNEQEPAEFEPAYRLGWKHYSPHLTFEAAEKMMSDEWAKGRGTSELDRDKAREAARAGWNKVSLQAKQGPGVDARG